jgi:DNA-binding transcriptional regulator YhcF (GntR family)
MQRALAELERSGLIYSQRTAGRFVTEDGELIKKMKESIGEEKILTFFHEMEQLGYGTDEIIALIHKVIKSI